MFRKVGDKVRVRIFGEVFNGVVRVVDEKIRRTMYQVWIDNGKHTTLWFNSSEVMEPLPEQE